MNKTKKKWNFHATGNNFLVRGSHKESLKQSMMIENNVRLSEHIPLFEYIFSVFDSRWYPRISLYFPLYPCLLE